MNRTIVAMLAILILGGAAFGLSITGRNALELRFGKKGEGGDFLENRFDLRLSESFITLGARFEAMHPSRASAISRPSEEFDEVTQRWAEIKDDRFDIVVGSFMATLGNGLLLDARERSEIQQDHHLDGVSARLTLPYSDINILAGVAKWNVLDNFSIKGIDLQSRDLPYLNLGAGYVAYHDAVDDSVLSDLEGEVWGVRAMPAIGPFSGEADYAENWSLDAAGHLGYANASIFAGPFVLFGEYLESEDFDIRGYDNNSRLVTLPLIVHQPSYTLMSRHLEEIDPLKTRAYSGEASYSFDAGDATLSAASVGDPDATEGYMEIYGSAFYDFDVASIKIVAEYQDFLGGDRAMNVVLEPLYYIDDRLSATLDLEFQNGVEYGEDVTNYYGLLELALSPYGSAGIEGGSIIDGGVADGFGRLFVDFNIGERHKMTLAYGKRPGGFTCSGGSCRYEPKFEGFEFKLVSNF